MALIAFVVGVYNRVRPYRLKVLYKWLILTLKWKAHKGLESIPKLTKVNAPEAVVLQEKESEGES